MPRALTDEEREVFDAIQNAGNIALVQTLFNGVETAIIAATDEDEEGVSAMYPLAVLITPEIMEMVTNPFEGEE